MAHIHHNPSNDPTSFILPVIILRTVHTIHQSRLHTMLMQPHKLHHKHPTETLKNTPASHQKVPKSQANLVRRYHRRYSEDNGKGQDDVANELGGGMRGFVAVWIPGVMEA